MPVLIDRGPCGYCVLGEAGLPPGDPHLEFRERETHCLDIAFINNMPDKALEATERQFLQLLHAAAENVLVRIKFFSLPDVPRTDWGQHHLRAHYSPIGELWNGRYDALIVTGTEPRALDLTQEPYWPTLTQVVDWADDNVVSAVWSCLAAHAAVLHLDGIGRHPTGEKRFGLFQCDKAADHPLTEGIAFPWWIPHSRWNELREGDLRSSGYGILATSAGAGVDTFVKRRNSLFVFFQGHPEYEPETLLREYRRDVGRFLKGEQTTYPAMPCAYVEHESAELLIAFRDRAIADRREQSLAAFPNTAITGRQAGRWRLPATRLYRNWLAIIGEQKGRQAGPARSAMARR